MDSECFSNTGTTKEMAGGETKSSSRRCSNVVEENAVRGLWTLGKVIETYPGRDGRIRNVKLKTALGEHTRPVTKVAVVYPVEGYSEEA